jgi:hypothetical protein
MVDEQNGNISRIKQRFVACFHVNLQKNTQNRDLGILFAESRRLFRFSEITS